MKTPTLYFIISLMIVFGCSTQKNNDESDNSNLESSSNENQEVTAEQYKAYEGDNDCIFDVEYQTSDFLEGKFDDYEWNDSTKTATIITAENDSLYITRGGCNHFEVAIKLITDKKIETMDTVYWLNKGKEIASKVYDEYHYHLLDSLIENKIYTAYEQEGNLQVIYEGDHGFSEFFTYVSAKEDKTQMELVYYFD